VRDNKVGDPSAMRETPESILDDKRIAAAVAKIKRDRAQPQQAYDWEEHKDTTYLTVVDRDRNAVSFINSLFQSFGSGICGPKSGVLLHNRGISFRVQPGHPNAIGPRKRPMHTIIPAMALKGGQAAVSFGVMGGAFQPMGHVHVFSNLAEHGMDPQEAIDHPRLFWGDDGVLEAESGVPESVRRGLAAKGHRVRDAELPHGGAQMIVIDRQSGFLIGGSDPRKDGVAIGW
jgi:gamma-glutamyltranspeptidase/glutathione hydrolase